MIPVNEPHLSGKEMEYVEECIRTNWISSAGRFIDEFERGWADYCGRKHGVAVCNGSVALTLAISALDLPEGSEVILPSFTIACCLEAVLQNRLVPVLVDCCPKTYTMDAADVRRKATSNTRAIMPVHIYGHPVEMYPLLALAREKGWSVVEDAAEAHGAEVLVDGEWKRCGSMGDVSCFSFYANKNITCGEGGMVLTDDDVLAEKLRSRRNLCFGKKERFLHEGRGWNFRMTNLQAAVGCAQLERIDALLARKLEMAARYNDGLAGLTLQLPFVERWAKSSVWMYAVVLTEEAGMDAKEFANKLMAKGVQTRPFFLGMHEQPVYHKMGLFVGERFPVTEHIARYGIYLPSGQAITNEQIDAVCEAVKVIF